MKFKRKSSWKAVSYSDRVAFRAQDCDITAYFATILAWIFELVVESCKVHRFDAFLMPIFCLSACISVLLFNVLFRHLLLISYSENQARLNF